MGGGGSNKSCFTVGLIQETTLNLNSVRSTKSANTGIKTASTTCLNKGVGSTTSAISLQQEGFDHSLPSPISMPQVSGVPNSAESIFIEPQ